MGDTSQIRPTNLLVSGTPYVDIRAMSPTVDISDGSVSAVAALAAAAAIGSPVLIPPGTYLIDASYSCTASLIMSGGKFSVTSGATLTLTGALEARPVQLFDGAGAISFSGNTSIPEVYPQWWGAKGDGVQDDAPALRKALTTGMDVFLIPGTYLMDSIDAAYNANGNSWVLKFVNNNQKLSGGPRAVIKFGAGMIDEGGQTYGAGMVLISGVSDIEISGILFDMNGANNLVGAVGVRNCIAIKVTSSNRIKIKDNHFYNCPGRNGVISDLNSYQIHIESNLFTNGGTSIPGNTNQGDWSAIYCESDETVVKNNIITHNAVPFAPAGGIEFHGSRMVGKDNIIKNSYPGIYIGGFGTRDISDLNISDNVMQDCRAGIMFSGQNIRRFAIVGNTIHLNRDQFTAYTADRACVGIRSYYDANNVYSSYYGSLIDGVISENIIVQTDTHTESQNGTGMILATMDGVSICNNEIRNVASIGIIFRGTPWETKNVKLIGNLIHDFGMNTTPWAHYAVQLSFAMTFTDPAESGALVSNVRNFHIAENTFSKTTVGIDNVYWADWNAASEIGFTIGQNNHVNIGGVVATGTRGPELVPGVTSIGFSGSKMSGFRFGKTSVTISDGGTIAHGMGSTLTAVFCSATVAGEFASVTGLSATNITVAIKKHDNSAGTPQYLYWLGII